MANYPSYLDEGDSSLDLYLKEISELELLTPEEEVELARRIKQNDPEAMEKLVSANLRFVVNVAKQYKNQGLSLADLINEGNMGLIRAAKRFDETKGYKFISYAVWWIRQAILQVLAEQSRIVRLPLNRAGALYKIGRVSNQLSQEFGREATPEEIAEYLDMKDSEVSETMKISSSHLSLDAPYVQGEDNTLLNFLEDTSQPKPDEDLMTSSLADDIEKVLLSLADREAEVIRLYFGLSGCNPMTLEEIGQKLKITRERVRQIKEKAIKRLQHMSRKTVLEPYFDRLTS